MTLARATQLTPNDVNAWQLLLDAQLQRRDFDAVINTGQTALTRFPNQVSILSKMIEAQLRSSQFDVAKGAALSLPESTERYFYLGILDVFSSQHDTAQMNFERIRNDTGYGAAAQLFLNAYDEYALFPDSETEHRTLLMAKVAE